MPVSVEAAIPDDILSDPRFDELGIEHGLEEGVNDQGPWARKPYIVPWLKRGEFIRAIVGTNGVTTGEAGAWIRPTRMRYPDPTFADNIFVRGVSVKAEGDYRNIGTFPIEYTNAIVTVDFGIVDFLGDDPGFLNSVTNDPAENEALQYATQELDFTAEYVNVPAKSVGFTDGLKYDIPMHRRVGVVKMSLTWHKVPFIPMSRAREYIDSVNNEDKFLGCNRGTVFFEGCRTVRELDSAGQITQKVQMSLKYRSIDWNWFLRPDNGTWGLIIYNGDPIKVTYPYKNFRSLIF